MVQEVTITQACMITGMIKQGKTVDKINAYLVDTTDGDVSWRGTIYLVNALLHNPMAVTIDAQVKLRKEFKKIKLEDLL